MEAKEQVEKLKRQRLALVSGVCGLEGRELGENLTDLLRWGVTGIGHPCGMYLLTDTEVPLVFADYGLTQRDRDIRTRIREEIEPEELKEFHRSMAAAPRSFLVRNIRGGRKLNRCISRYFEAEGIQSVITVPIEPEKGGPGVILVLRPRGACVLERDDVSFVKGLAGLAGMAIQKRGIRGSSSKASDEEVREVVAGRRDGLRRKRTYTVRVENSKDIIFWINRYRRFVYINEAMELMVGLKRAELCGSNLRAEDMVAYEDRDRVKRYMENLLSGEAPILKDIEFRHRDSQGYERTLLLTAYPGKDMSGNIVGVEAIGRDITDRRLLETELENSKNLALLGEFSAAVAHQIRNPLSNILMGSKRLQKALGLDEFRKSEPPDSSGPSGDSEKRLLDKIFSDLLEGIHSLNQVVSELLEYTKTLRLSRSMQRVEMIVSETLKSMDELWEQRSIEIREHYDGNLPFLSLDAVLMAQVFKNIAHNAMEAMRGGGCLRISTGFCPERPGYAWVAFSDTGAGIIAPEIEKIFRPFYTTKDSGTGLGLSLAHRIVEAHGGQISISNHSTKGATVTIVLPIHGS